MTLRLLRPALLTAVLLTVAVPHAASAADAVLHEPASAVVNGASRLVVRVATTAQDRAERIDANLRHLDGGLAPEARHTLCGDAATCSRERADYAIEFDPRSGAPFLSGADAQILPNGGYLLRVVVTRAEDLGVQTIDLPLTISAPGTAPTQVQADVEDGEVELTWDPAPEPDVAGYLVERASDAGWSLLAEVPASATSLGDVPGVGVHAYRVVTLRPDGRGATYETVSREVSVEVASADPPVEADQPTTPGRDVADAPATTGTATDPPPSSAPPADAVEPDPDAASTPTPDAADQERQGSPSPTPNASFTARTVTEDGELVFGLADTAGGPAPESSSRPVAAIVVGLVFIGLAVRVWRRSRPVHRPPG